MKFDKWHMNLFSLLSIILFIQVGTSSTPTSLQPKNLTVGEELKGETLHLKFGQKFYKLVGLKENFWYEVKISYPASIPASFSIELKNDLTDEHRNSNRRLLNTEKLIFKAESTEKVHVLVTVNAEGVVAQPNVQERELVLYNIVCDELMLGIPRFTWWVGFTAFLCLLFAFIFPHYFPLHRLLEYNAQNQKEIRD
ncbi:caveolin-1 protein [Rhynchospora pubera]|uniref:Caveolin-1 protein n=1 Tax=Rhynchospora pubera TaxID=906938 RepID=A0AAV8H5B6_9POAL|nr:caveolin-1 protein [Rhynchospora pubera]KAJ4813028.1 caveolin-1 protein [Rhynchospora pubera]